MPRGRCQRVPVPMPAAAKAKSILLSDAFSAGHLVRYQVQKLERRVFVTDAKLHSRVTETQSRPQRPANPAPFLTEYALADPLYSRSPCASAAMGTAFTTRIGRVGPPATPAKAKTLSHKSAMLGLVGPFFVLLLLYLLATPAAAFVSSGRLIQSQQPASTAMVVKVGVYVRKIYGTLLLWARCRLLPPPNRALGMALPQTLTAQRIPFNALSTFGCRGRLQTVMTIRPLLSFPRGARPCQMPSTFQLPS